MPPECVECGNDEAFIIRHTVDEMYMYESSGLRETMFIEEINAEWIECNECGSREVEMNF